MSLKGNNYKLISLIVIVILTLIMAGSYLLYGVPHEFLSGEYKGTFEGDYDFTLELVDNLRNFKLIPLWSRTFSGPIFVFAANLHVFGQALLYFFTRDLALSIKIYQLIYFILAGTTMLLLADYLYKHKLAALFSAILYMFTPFFIGEMLSYLHYSPNYFCMPLVFLFLFKSLESKKRRIYLLLAALVITFNFLAHPQNIFIGGIFYFLFALFILVSRLFLILFKSKERQLQIMEFKNACKVFLSIALIVVLLSSFFLLPTLIHGYPYTRSLGQGGTWLQQISRQPDAHSRHHSQSFITSITLFHWPWFITPLKLETYPALGFMVIYALPFILAVSALFFGFQKENRGRLWIFLILGVISLLFSMGTREKFLNLFSLAYRYIPFFHMGRTPYRFFYQGVLSVCLLSGLVISRLPKKFGFVLFLVVVMPYLYGAHFYSKTYNWTFLPSEKPLYFSQVQNWLRDNNTSKHRVIETCGIPTSLAIGQRMLPNGLDLLERNLDKDYLDKFLGLLGIKYILAPRLHCQRESTFDKKGYCPPRADDGYEDLEDLEEYYSALTTEYYFVYQKLNRHPQFKFYTADTKDVAIFENRSAFENHYLYPAKAVMVLGGVNAYDFLNLKKFEKYFAAQEKIRLAPVFITQSDNLNQIERLRYLSKDLVLHNSDALDLFFLLNQRYITFLSSLRRPDWYFFSQSFGCQQPVPYHDHALANFIFGDFSFSDFSLVTQKKNASLSIPLVISAKDSYRIMLRAYGTKAAGSISVYLNDQYLKTLDLSQQPGASWTELWQGNLQVGNYVLRLTSESQAEIYLDAIATISNREFKQGIEQIGEQFSETTFSYIVNAEKLLGRQGYYLLRIFLARDNKYDLTLRLFNSSSNSIDGQLNLELDSGHIATLNYGLSGNQSLDLTLTDLEISAGRHELTLKDIPNSLTIKFMAISEKGKSDIDSSVQQGLKVDYRQILPEVLRVTHNSKGPLIFVLNETNYPGWQALQDRKIISPIIVNLFQNAFIIDGPQESGFYIFYFNYVQWLGIIISFLAALFVIRAIIIDFFKLKSERKRINE